MSRETDEDAVEQRVQETAKTTNRLTPSDIDKVIKTKQFYVFPGTAHTVCLLTLQNGFTVSGEAASVDLLNFNREIGEDVAFANARQQIWPLEGYRLKQAMHELAQLPEPPGTARVA